MQDDLFGRPPAPNDRSPEPLRAHACRCEQCCPDNPARTYTEAFRHECEVRYLAAMPSNEHRREYLEGPKGVFERRGPAQYFRLRSDTWNLIRSTAEAQA